MSVQHPTSKSLPLETSGEVPARSRGLEVWAFRLLCAAAFGVAFSLPLGRVMVGLSLIVLVTDCVKRRRMPAFPPVAWGWLAFLAVAVLASVLGVNPSRSFGKLDKLLWFLAIPISATLVQDRTRVRGVLTAFAAGVGVLALEILIWRPVAAWLAVREVVAAGGEADYLWEITDLGSMTDGQVLMLGIVALAGLIISLGAVGDRSLRRRLIEGVGLALFVAALIVNLKRGSWICTFAVMGVFAATRMKLRYLVILAVVAMGVLLLPPVWGRFSDLRNELDGSRGGRVVMWTRIAPPLIKAHPLGIGYRALTSEMMQDVAREQGIHVETGRNHLHSNPVQVLVAMGWLGLAVYLVWMGVGFTSAGRGALRSPPGSAERTLALSLLLMLAGLFLNGLVEYNFADGELVILYGLILGTAGGRCFTIGTGTP